MKSTFLVLFLSFVTFLSASSFQRPNALVARSYTAKKLFFDNKELLKLMLEMVGFKPSFRLISKDFKDIHDEFCNYYLSQTDSRLRNYLNNIRYNGADDYFVPSLVSPTLRLEIPLYYLFSKYLKDYASTVPKTANTEITAGMQDALTLRRADIAEGTRFIKDVLKAFTRQVFGAHGQNASIPEPFLYLYILTKSCFNASQFNQLGFPISHLLLNAVKGFYPGPYGEEIVRDFNINSPPKLVHEAFKSGRIDLARIILNKTDATNNLATFTDPETQMTTLHYCAKIGAIDLIEKCLEMGATPLLTDSRYFRPIHYAVESGHLEAVNRLFELDQDVLYSSTDALSPVLVACYNRRAEIMELFLSRPSITLIGDTLLSDELAEIVLSSGDVRMAQVILDSGKLDLSSDYIDRLYILSMNF